MPRAVTAHPAVTAFVLRRLGQLLLVLWGAVTLLFFLFFLLPDNPAELIAGGKGKVPDPQVVANVEKKYGLDEPVPVQYVKYLGRLVTFDFGESYSNGEPVTDIIKQRAPASLRLATWAILVEAFVGIGAGILSAIRKYSIADTLTTLLAAVLSAIPVFVLGYLFQQVFGVHAFKAGWPEWAQLPVQGIGPNSWFLWIFPTAAQVQYLILPTIVLASVSTVIVARLARTTMLEVGRADYIRTARSKGLKEGQITTRHALRNAMIPVVTFIGIDFGVLVGSAILTETVFNWPGLGSEIAQAASARDLPVLVGLTFVVVLVYGLVNMAVDISYAWFDPRVRLEEGAVQ